MATGWPASCVDGDVRLRPLRRRDQDAWMALRAQNAAWLEPWDATSPVPVHGSAADVRAVRAVAVRAGARRARRCRSPSTYDGRLVGQLTVSSITLRLAALGGDRVLGVRARRRPGHHADRRRAGHRPLLRRARAAPRRDQHPPGERAVAARRREAGLPRRGPARAVPAHPGPLVRPPHVRPDRRGRPRRAARAVARVRHCPGDAQADTPRRSPSAGRGRGRLPS